MDREDALKLGIIGIVLLADVIGMRMLGLGFDWPSAITPVVAWTGLLGLGWFYLTLRLDPPISHLLRETAHLVGFSAAAAILSYLATASDRPLIDEALVAVDRWIGFDWLGYVAAVNQSPWLGSVSSFVYISTLPQVAVAAIVLPLLGLTDRSREFVLALMFAALIAILISAILPSAGALAFYRPDAAFLVNAPMVDLAYKDEFYRMRALEIPVLSLDEVKGLIAFPSYHVVMSVLIALTFRGRWAFFVPVGLLNLAVLLATPIDGGHHVSDVLGGVLVALISLTMAQVVRSALHGSSVSRPAAQAVIVARAHDPVGPNNPSEVEGVRTALPRPVEDTLAARRRVLTSGPVRIRREACRAE